MVPVRVTGGLTGRATRHASTLQEASRVPHERKRRPRDGGSDPARPATLTGDCHGVAGPRFAPFAPVVGVAVTGPGPPKTKNARKTPSRARAGTYRQGRPCARGSSEGHGPGAARGQPEPSPSHDGHRFLCSPWPALGFSLRPASNLTRTELNSGRKADRLPAGTHKQSQPPATPHKTGTGSSLRGAVDLTKPERGDGRNPGHGEPRTGASPTQTPTEQNQTGTERSN